MKTRKRIGQQGFSLIEVMVAITIFAIGLLAVVTMQLTAIKGNSYSRRMTEADIWQWESSKNWPAWNMAILF